MAVTARSWMDEDRVGHVVLSSDTVWPTASWTGESFISNVYTRYNLYPLLRSGVGALSDGGHTLTILLPFPPRNVTITVGSFSKRFSFFDGSVELSKELVYAPSFSVTSRNSGIRSVNGFLIFNGSPQDYVRESSVTAKLVVGEEVIGYALGLRFVNASGPGGMDYAFGGVVFPRVVWVERPSVPMTLEFIVRLGVVHSYKVYWDGTQFTGPTSSRFNVQSSHTFYTERYGTANEFNR